MKYLLFYTMVLLSTAAKADIIEFKLQTDNQSCKGLSQVVITQDKIVLYQLEVPMYGTGQVHLLTGNFQIDVINKAGCAYQNIIQVSDLSNKTVDVKLESQARNSASVMNPEVVGAQGTNGNEYPYGGLVALEKSNIYFAEKDEGKFKLKISSDDFNFLATVPSFKDKEISGELRKGSIYAENIWYPHIFYGARVSDDHLQNTQGFCGTRNEIFQFMIEGLKKYEFPDQARADFVEYGSVKIFEASRYCVYPQASAQLDKVAPLEITFDDKSQVRTERLFYLVIPQDFNGKRLPAKSHRFVNKPKNLWKHYTRTVIPKTPYLYEWGVGFVLE